MKLALLLAVLLIGANAAPSPGFWDDLINKLTENAQDLLNNLADLDLDQTLKDLWAKTYDLINSSLKTEWDHIKEKSVDVAEILKEFGKALANSYEKGAQNLENFFKKLENKYPDIKEDLEKIKIKMLEALPKLDDLIDNILYKLGNGVEKAKEYFGDIDVDEEIKILFKKTVQKIKNLDIKEEWDKIKGKIDIDEILHKFGKSLHDGSKDLENYINELKSMYPEAKKELEEIENPMMEAVRSMHRNYNSAVSFKPKFNCLIFFVCFVLIFNCITNIYILSTDVN